MLECLRQDPSQRPTAAQLVARLGAFVEGPSAGASKAQRQASAGPGIIRAASQPNVAALSPFAQSGEPPAMPAPQTPPAGAEAAAAAPVSQGAPAPTAPAAAAESAAAAPGEPAQPGGGAASAAAPQQQQQPQQQ